MSGKKSMASFPRKPFIKSPEGVLSPWGHGGVGGFLGRCLLGKFYCTVRRKMFRLGGSTSWSLAASNMAAIATLCVFCLKQSNCFSSCHLTLLKLCSLVTFSVSCGTFQLSCVFTCCAMLFYYAYRSWEYEEMILSSA